MLVGVVGAGAMGTGIAQVAATAGDRVIIADATPNATEKARASIAKTLDREVEKQRLSRDDADAVLSRIEFQEQALHGDAGAYRDCDLVVEAIRDETGREPELSTSGGTSDGRFLIQLCPVVDFGLPNATMHKVGECAAVEDIRVLSRVYQRIIERMVG